MLPVRRVVVRRAWRWRRASSIAALAGRLDDVPPERMVTFSIVAHVDHGKSSLSQRLLERAGNVAAARGVGQGALDTLAVERERGITVKAVAATMAHRAGGADYVVNLVDTPGHADFADEVTRSLAACDGALLLVDAAQGVEAQTFKVAEAAARARVPLVAACSKVDLATADATEVALDVATLGFVEDPEAVLRVSAKTGEGVDAVLDAVVAAFAPPPRDRAAPLRCRVLDSRYDLRRGVVSVVQVVDGVLDEGDRVRFLAHGAADFGVQECGLLTPAPLRTGRLVAGCVGYVVCGLRDVRQAVVGDTMAADGAAAPLASRTALASPPALYASVFPPDGAAFDDMRRAVDRLALNDASVTVRREPPRAALGLGLRLGFLGLLHLEIFQQRLRDEFDEDVLFTAPLVPYKAVVGGETRAIATLDDWPAADELKHAQILEPRVRARVLTPEASLGDVLGVLEDRVRGTQRGLDVLANGAFALDYELPWADVVDGLAETLANATAGYASLAVDAAPFYAAADVVKVEVATNGAAVDALSFACARAAAAARGRRAAARLKAVVPRQQFEVVIQARVGSKVLARERVPPLRKDVLTTKAGKAVGGGDVTRKKKVLEKQKRGKARQKTIGGVTVGQAALWAVVGSR